MPQNSMQNSDDDVRGDFANVCRAILRTAPPTSYAEMGAALDDYMMETEHASWEGYSDAEIIAVYTLFADVAQFIANR